MLVLERKVNDSFSVMTPAGAYEITVVQIVGGRVRLGITAPREWPIERDDIKNKK